MWINPKYRDQVEQPRPPQETGQRLATFPRGDGAEMRVSLAEYQGRPYIALRVWEKGQDGEWWPCKGKGCSVRLSEAAGLADALQSALGAAGELGRRQDRAGQGRGDAVEQRDGPTRYVDKGRQVRPPWEASALAPSEPPGDAEEFNECS